MDSVALFDIETNRHEKSVHLSGYTVLDLLKTNGTIKPVVGGSSANVAIGLSLFGWKTSISGLLGQDAAGKLITEQLMSYGVDVSGLRLSDDVATPVLVYEVNDDKHAFKFSCPSCGARYPKFRPLPVAAASLAPDSAVYYFDRASAYSAKLAELGRARRGAVVFEPGSPGRPAANQRLISLCHLYRASADLTVANDGSEPDGAQVIGLADRGAQFKIGDSPWRRLPSMVSGTPVDSGGAGDWLTIGCVHTLGAPGILEPSDNKLHEAVQFGQRLAAAVCQHEGTRGFVEHLPLAHLLELGVRHVVPPRRGEVAVDAANCPDWFCPSVAHGKPC